jgi:hypothetical protein
MMALAEIELARVDWSKLREIAGGADGVGRALGRLLAAGTPADATDAYWQIENHVVVQGELFEAAEPAVSVLVAAFADERPRHVRIAALDLLYQILAGLPGPVEREAGNDDLLARCQARAREGFWLLLHEFLAGESAAALDVLKLIASDDLLRSYAQIAGLAWPE